MSPTLAVTVPVPTVPALKVVGLPGFGEKVPTVGEIDQVGATETRLP
jgi:hypothetical protein